MTTSTLREQALFGLPPGLRPRRPAALWLVPPRGWRGLLESRLTVAPTQVPTIFFRADDIGAGGMAFDALCRLFRKHDVPLGMAVVPAWLSDTRRDQLLRSAPLGEQLWEWHQHGWRHVNWQRMGGNSEFGEQRPIEKQLKDIAQGQRKLGNIFGKLLLPIFTPPWDSLSGPTLRILQELGFEGVSMSSPFPRGNRSSLKLVNLKVRLELHNRGETGGAPNFPALVDELSSMLAAREPVGIVLHHQMMTCFAFEFLDELLLLVKQKLNARLPAWGDILREFR